MKPLRITILALVGGLFSAGLAVAAWSPGDEHSMHYPQMPDPNGWDICLKTEGLSSSFWDDWQCTSPAAVTGIDFWVSFEGYNSSDPPPLPALTVGFYEDVPADPPGVPFSRPGDRLKYWNFTPPAEVAIRHAGTGLQGWHDPKINGYTTYDDHTEYFQVSVDLTGRTPFVPEVGTTYWLYVNAAATDPRMGWKTSGDHFQANAVWGYGSGYRYELTDPGTGGPLGLAFVITPEPGMFALAAIGLAGPVGLAFGRRRRR